MNDKLKNLMVRVKLVDLDHPVQSAPTPSTRSSDVKVSCLVGSTIERKSSAATAGTGLASDSFAPAGDICLKNRDLMIPSEFESHIDSCGTCSNRVELQLDFIATLEVAIYQRRAQPESEKVRGALLVSAPALNFAICGELEI